MYNGIYIRIVKEKNRVYWLNLKILVDLGKNKLMFRSQYPGKSSPISINARKKDFETIVNQHVGVLFSVSYYNLLEVLFTSLIIGGKQNLSPTLKANPKIFNNII